MGCSCGGQNQVPGQRTKMSTLPGWVTPQSNYVMLIESRCPGTSPSVSMWSLFQLFQIYHVIKQESRPSTKKARLTLSTGAVVTKAFLEKDCEAFICCNL
jgi:hypothetical protein